MNSITSSPTLNTIIEPLQQTILDLLVDFYINISRFYNKFEFPRQAIFMASGLYHYYIAINIWDSANMKLREDGDLGLNYFEIIVEDENELDRIKTHLKDNNVFIKEINDGFIVKDNQNINILIKY